MTDNTQITVARIIRDIIIFITLAVVIVGLGFFAFLQYSQNNVLRNNNLIMNVQLSILKSGGKLPPPPPPPKPVTAPKPDKPEPPPDASYILPGFNIPEDVERRLISYTSAQDCPTHGVVCDWRYA